MIAFGQLGLHPWEFDEYTMDDLVLRLEGHQQNEVKEWERARLIAYYTFLPNAKNKKLRIDKFLPLPSDKKGERRDGPPMKGRPIAEVLEKLEKLEKAKWEKVK